MLKELQIVEMKSSNLLPRLYNSSQLDALAVFAMAGKKELLTKLIFVGRTRRKASIDDDDDVNDADR